MKTNLSLIALLSATILISSCFTASCNKRKLVGTSWRMYQYVQALDDGPSLTFDKTLRFVDNRNVEILDVNESSGYASSFVNQDGNVEYHPGAKTEDAIKATYSVSGNVITITVDGKAENYIIRPDYLIYDLSEEEYDKLSDFEKEYYTYKKQ